MARALGGRLSRPTMLLVLSVLAVALAAPASALTQTPVRQLPLQDHLKVNLSASGHLLAYQAGYSLEETQSIRVFDLDTNVESVVASVGRDPEVYGDRIVYTRDTEVRLYDYKTKKDVLIASDPEFCRHARISKDTVVWTTPSGVHGKNLVTGKEFSFPTDAYGGSTPEIAAGWVVFRKSDNILGYEIKTGRIVTICGAPGRQYNPQIGENGIVVWHDERKRNYSDIDVYGASVYDRKEFAVANGPGVQSMATVQGDVIVYFDDRKPGGYEVMGLDRLSGTVFGMCSPNYLGTEMTDVARLDDGSVAWTKVTVKGYSDWDTFWTSVVYVAEPARIGAISGADRYDSAVAVSRTAYPDGAARAVVASGLNWPDALAGAGLAGTDAPLLLTDTDSLPAATANELRRLKVTSVDILGGESAVSVNVQRAITAIVAENLGAIAPAYAVSAGSEGVRRFGGSSRVEVSGAIAQEVMSRPGWDGTVVVASGRGFADALAASPIAAHNSLPVMLTGANGLSDADVDRMKSLGADRVILVGGVAAVPDVAFRQAVAVVGAENVRRLEGKNRYETAGAIASFGVSDYGLTWSRMGIVSGTSFADAMVGGVLKGKQGSVMLLTDGVSLSTSTANVLRAKRATVRSADYVGGTAVVSRNVRTQVRMILR